MPKDPVPQLHHRLENPFTQTAELAQEQMASGRLLGKAPNFDLTLCVKAYLGPLPDGSRGIEFTTTIAHDQRYSTPSRAYWYYPHTAGVTLVRLGEDDFACIPVTVIRIVAV